MRNTWMNKAALATGTAALLTAMIGSAHAEPTGYDQLTFQTEVKEEIQNDEVRATMYKKAQASDAKTLATTLNTSINNAMKKRSPEGIAVFSMTLEKKALVKAPIHINPA